MKKNFVKSRWFFTMLLFVTTMIMPSMMLAKSITPTKPNGEGTAEKPYQIGNAAELYWFAGLVNGTLEGVQQDKSAHAKLTTDITVNEGVLDENKNLVSKSDLTEWEPIGARWSPYTGTFDGQGYTISGLYFNNPTSSYVGLFGNIGANGKISNVGVLDSYFQFSTLGGGVCGVNYGTVRDCRNTGSVRGFGSIGGVCGFNEKGGIIENSFNEGTVSVSGTGDNVQNVGGVSGNNNGTIKSCYNTASVSGQVSVGGVCGFNSVGTITNCFNEGTVSGQNIVGGVCGNGCGVTTTNCFNGGTVSGQSHVSGVCGYDYNYDGTLTNCYYLSDTATGGINGKDVSGTAEGKSIEQFKSGEVAWLLNGSTSAPAEGSTLAWYQKLGDNADAYPVLKSTGDNTVYQAPLISCDGTTPIGEYANNPNGDQLSHNYQMATVADANGLYGGVCVECNSPEEGVKYIKDFCGILGNNLKLTYADGKYTAKAVTFTDGEAYNSPVDIEVADFKYIRTFDAYKWQSLYVPFRMSLEQLTSNGLNVATPVDIEVVNETITRLNVQKLKSGSSKANYPSLIMCESDGEKTIELADVTLSASKEKFIDCMSMTRKYVFNGVYQANKNLASNSEDAINYIIKDGGLVLRTDDDVPAPQSWYMNVTIRESPFGGADEPLSSDAKTMPIYVIGEGYATGIENVNTAEEHILHGIYDLQGRKLSQEPESGIYIKDGKKYVK
uniref:hypothetical protein n=1 Tax=Prevotella sp. TaxID=59823 RepID=UPI00260022D5|nr:hypothetical protein [Prevotella sp.]